MKIIKMKDTKDEKDEDLIWIILRECYMDEDEGPCHYIFATKDKKIFQDYKDEKKYVAFNDPDGEECILNKKDIVGIHH